MGPLARSNRPGDRPLRAFTVYHLRARSRPFVSASRHEAPDGTPATRALPGRRGRRHVYPRRRARRPVPAGDQPEHQETRGRAGDAPLRSRPPRHLADRGREGPDPLRAQDAGRARRCHAPAGIAQAPVNGNAEHRLARIGGGLPAAGGAPALPAGVSGHQGRDLPQPAQGHPQASDGSRDARRVRQGRAQVQGAHLRPGPCRRNGAGGQPRPPVCAAG